MLEHRNASPQAPARVVVIGANGFVGGAMVARLARERIPTLALSRGEIDLLQPGAAEKLAGLLGRPTRGCRLGAGAGQEHAHAGRQSAHGAGHGRGAGQGAGRASRQHQLGRGLCRRPAAADRRSRPRRRPACTARCMLARELAFRAEVKAPLAHLRPTLIYGASDPHNGYGPNRFRRLADEGEDIVLFGEGEERRDHVYVDDVAEIIARVLKR